jgi:hypothetical protein
MWRHCGCGYDFGATQYSRTAEDAARPSGEIELQEVEAESLARQLQPIWRFLWWLQMGCAVMVWINELFHGPGWLTLAATSVFVGLFWVPCKPPLFGKARQRKTRSPKAPQIP